MAPPAPRFRSILITGASSGLGAAVALAFAEPGVVLALVGRAADRLAATAAAVQAAGATARVAGLDVTDREAMRTQLLAWDAEQPFDLVLANAGIGNSGAPEAEATLRRTTAVNIDGTINTLAPLLPALIARGRGQIGLSASLAGFRGLPGAPSYCASKAWMRIYGESLRLDLAASGIGVSVICPGFVRTPMTAGNRAPMPFLMEPEAAARIMRRGLEANRPRIAFPWPMVAAIRLLEALPVRWSDALLRRAAGRSAAD